MNDFNLRKYLKNNPLLKENITPPMEDYLLGMFEEFAIGNDEEYPAGTKMETSYQEMEKGNDDYYGEEEVELFYNTRDFLNTQGPITLMRKIGQPIELTFSVEKNHFGETDIILNWIEPD